jgi:potassium efflux system protein
MRATTLVNFDRQELIIPNKDLITGKLLNWTLSDTTNRIQIRVGLAYGTDTQRACEILESICQAHPNIMKDPALTVSFENFGESSLDVTIRAFLANLEVRLQTIHELHTSIYRELTAAGMEIAFPQRDLHIRSLPNYLLQSLTRPAAGSPTSETA